MQLYQLSDGRDECVCLCVPHVFLKHDMAPFKQCRSVFSFLKARLKPAKSLNQAPEWVSGNLQAHSHFLASWRVAFVAFVADWPWWWSEWWCGAWRACNVPFIQPFIVSAWNLLVHMSLSVYLPFLPICVAFVHSILIHIPSNHYSLYAFLHARNSISYQCVCIFHVMSIGWPSNMPWRVSVVWFWCAWLHSQWVSAFFSVFPPCTTTPFSSINSVPCDFWHGFITGFLFLANSSRRACI